MLAENTISCKIIFGLRIKNMDDTLDISLPGTYIRQSIPASHDLIPRAETVGKWPHLKEVARKLPPYDRDTRIGLLIGTNCAQVLKPREVVSGHDNEPYAIKTDLGWGVIGNVSRDRSNEQDNSVFTLKTCVRRSHTPTCQRDVPVGI
jgi:hypothetical protein